MAVNVVKIEDGKGDYIVINAGDFDPKTMTEFKEGAAPSEAPPVPKKRGRPKKAQ
tara:strand:- start:888 stop:1052 length:165 start_codon:yes stop_codon:yes gene_type:complete